MHHKKNVMKIVFLDAATLGEGADLSPIAKLGELTCYPNTTPQDVVERIGDAQVVITNKVRMTKEVIDACPNLRLIAESATGTDNIDIEYARSKGIAVKNVAGYSTDSVCSLTFALYFHLASNLAYYDAYCKDGRYSASGIFTHIAGPLSQVAGRKWGIVGMGNIGSQVARVATAFGASVAYFSTSGTGHNTDYPCMELEELVKWADVISIHAPLNDRTRGLFDAKAFAAIKPGAILLNLGRGPIVDEKAVSDALREGRLGGFGCDVFTKEPLPADSPLLQLPQNTNLVLTPHIGWASSEAIVKLIDGIAKNIASII